MPSLYPHPMAKDGSVLDRALRQLGSLAARAEGVEAYLVGGAVRDGLLGREVREADLAVAGNMDAFLTRAAAALATRPVSIGNRFPLWRLPLEEGYIDVTPLRGSNIAEDLGLRDLTVNSTAVPLDFFSAAKGLAALRRNAVIDPYGGIRDLEQRVLRLTTPDALRTDPVRALRVVRLACQLDFEVPPDTRQAMRALGDGVTQVAAERVGGELLRLFETPRAARGVRLMDESGLLGSCFEPLEAGRGIEQRPFHRYSVLEHALVAAEWMDVLLATEPPQEEPSARMWRQLWQGVDWASTRWGDIRTHLDRHAAALRVATLLHDVGKPATRTVEADGRTRFFGHSEVGAALAASVLTRWRFPTDFTERVRQLVLQHLRPGQVGEQGEPPTPRALHRFQRSLGDATPDVCWLFLADSLATVGPDALLPKWPAYVGHVHRLITWTPSPTATAVQRVVDGHAVMATAGIPPGPLVGGLLEAVREAVAAGEVLTVDDALALVRSLAEDARANPSP